MGQAGDTIVEVMVVLAVLGLAIGISYATANRSLLNARQAQENSQATTAAQSQVEQLVSIGCASSDPACATNNPLINYLAANPPNSSFCIVSGQVKASTDPGCQNIAFLPGSQIKITCITSCTPIPPPASPARVFEVTVSWDDVLGQGQDQVTQDYALPQ
jgi:prepilin-type N-terminal cleavage/methylation domain-containing protein